MFNYQIIIFAKAENQLYNIPLTKNDDVKCIKNPK